MFNVNQIDFKNNEYISNTPINLSNTTKEEIFQYFHNTFSLYEYLFSGISDKNGFFIAPDPLRRQLIFYYGHTAALYINKLKLANLSDPINEFFEKIFATGVDPIHPSELDNEKYQLIWPKLSEVEQYRKDIYKKMKDLIFLSELELPIRKDSCFWLILLTCEHERIHFETTTCLFRQLDVKYFKSPGNWRISSFSNSDYPQNDMIEVDGSTVEIGKRDDFPSYGWDNEYGQIKLQTKNIRVSKFKISIGEYLIYFNKGEYEKREFWSEEGWNWKQDRNSTAPLYFVKVDHGYKYRTIFEIIEMPLNWPVEVNYHEAYAYMKWLEKENNLGPNKQYRFIKEEEFKLIRCDDQIISENKLSPPFSDFIAFSKKKQNIGNVNVAFGSSTPVDYYPPSKKGFYDTIGNVWEWSDTLFRPLPGFKPEKYYLDFSGPCFDFHHVLILGSAWSSTGLSASKFARIAFRKHFYQNVGFRIVEEDKLQPETEITNIYENKRIIGDYLITFYNERVLKENIFDQIGLDMNIDYKDFGVKVAEHCIDYYKKVNEGELKSNRKYTALDLGCGVGKTSFALTKFFYKVTGIDYSNSFINICKEIKEKGEYSFEYLKNGDSMNLAKAILDSTYKRDNVNFLHGDAHHLSINLGPFDLIAAVNLIDRLRNPIQCLVELHNRLNKGGILVLVSPYTFMTDYTEKENWIGGKDGLDSFIELKKIMQTLCFDLVDQKTLSLFIREHERKFQLCLPHMTVWKKTQFNEEFATSIFK